MSYDIDDHVLEHFALTWLIETLRTIVSLAAAAQVNTCGCGRVRPWERIGMSRLESCYVCTPERDLDRYRRSMQEHRVREASEGRNT